MIVLGLTGSIGMGKSTAADNFRRLGVPVFDSDAEVHRLMEPGGRAVAAVEAAFAGSRDETGGIDRQKLGAAVFGDEAARRTLEGILHPRVGRAQREFRSRNKRARADLVVLDVPLLFETGGERRCDATCVVSAPAFVQAARVLARPGMTRQKYATILKAQMPDREKRRLADYVINTGAGRNFALNQIKSIIADLTPSAEEEAENHHA